MKGVSTAWVVPDRTVEKAEAADREVRITDFLLMATLAFRTENVGPVPVNEVTMALLVGLCLFRPARGGSRVPGAMTLLLGALLVLLVASGLLNGIDWTRRVGHVTILVGLIWALATGRVSLRSAALGLGTGLLVVVSLTFVGIGGDNYPGRLTGFFGDPNAGAYFIVVLGIVAVFFSDHRWQVRVAIAVPIIIGLVLTFSRSGLLAGAFAIGWMLLGRRISAARGAAVTTGLVWLIANLPNDARLFGPFSNRSGSDALRDRIIAQEKVVLADAPWFGHGPGTAIVNVRDLEFFFHNSYLSTLQEGGWLALILVLSAMAFAFFRLSARARQGDLAAAAAQAGIVGVAVVAITLGEVLLDTPMAIAVGFALGHAGLLEIKPEPGTTPDG